MPPRGRHGAARRLAAMVLAAALALPASAHAQRDTAARADTTTRAPVAPTAAPEAAAAAGAPVVFAGDTLFRLYGSLGPFTAQSRAAAVPGRLLDLENAARRGGADSVVVLDHESFSEIAVGDRVVMTVLDSDAAAVGRPRRAVARQYATVVQRALREAVENVSLQSVLLDFAYALAATIVLVLLLWAMRLGFPRIYRRIDALRRIRMPALRIQQFELLSAGRLSKLLETVARVVRLVLTLGIFYVYVPLVLSFFPWTAALSHRIVAYALGPFGAAWSALVGYLPSLFYLIAGVVIARYVLVFVRMIFEAVGTGAITIRGFYSDWADPTYKIVRVLVLAFTAIALYPYLPGASSDAFKGVSLFLGVLFSLGSSAAVGNVVAGVVLTYTRAFQLGDRVRIGETVGDVIEKTLLVTRLRTIKNVAVTIPNGAVLASQVVNFTTLAAGPGLILHTSVTIGYDAPWQRVHELLIEAARRTGHVRAEPAPFVLQTSLDDFYVSYELNAYTDRADIMQDVYSQLHANIQDAFAAGGVEIMSPHYAALRDGNEVAIPASQRPPDYRVPPFRVAMDGRDGD